MSEEDYELQNLNQKEVNGVNRLQGTPGDIIDYVLVYKCDEDQTDKRRAYERNLGKVGLILSALDSQESIAFTSVYAPDHVLRKYCRIMKLHMPVTQIADSPPFAPSIRSMIVRFILAKEKLKHAAEGAGGEKGADDSSDDDDDDDDNDGISKLIGRGVYEAAYPLHTDRTTLLNEWASLGKMYKAQPLDAIKEYFGMKIALYFAWIGFYTFMLIPASIVGVLCMVHGFVTLSTDNISSEVCRLGEDVIMCPQCDKHCDYWQLRDLCTFSLITHLFDNTFTVVFTVLMSVWSAVYLNLWSRYSTRIVHRWGMTNALLADNEVPTIQFLNGKARWYRRSKCGRLQRISFSFAVVLFWLSLVIGIVLALMFYRISLSTSEKIFGVKGWIVIVTGSVFDLITILVLNHFYNHIARWLTEQEMHRTQAQFESSLTWKIYLFWFVNYYSSSVHVAFIKGKFIGHPGAYQRIFGFRQEECGPGGCIVDLFIQIAIIMIGDLTYNNIVEYLVPWIQKKFQACRIDAVTDEEENRRVASSQWMHDLKLLYWGNYELSTEYLEMILQYGLVTLFVAAFPLAPLVALLNNVFEIRMDARKLLTNYRRPVAQNAHNIGTWLTIMHVVSRMSILSNACIIAFSTNFIPQFFYTYLLSPDNTDSTGFFNYTLAYFNTSDFGRQVLPVTSQYRDVRLCRYTDYRNPPWHEDKYNLSKFYWHVLAAKLIFVLIYQNFVVVLQTLVSWVIPEMPKKLKKHILNEAIRTQNLVLRTERARREETTEPQN